MEEEIQEHIDLDEVLKFATERHEGQFRANGEPYVSHPIRVMNIVRKFKPSKHQDILSAGALLHDVLEDTYTSYRELIDRFGLKVASLVMEVTNSGYVPRMIGKQVYLAHKMRYMSSYALIIKLADRLDNLTDTEFVDPEKVKRTFFDTIYMINYIESKRILTEPQKNLVQAIRDRLMELNKSYKFTEDKNITETDLDQD